MIATHNIKVNDRWVRAGEEYQPEQEKAKPARVKVVKEEPVKAESETAAEPKPEEAPAENKEVVQKKAGSRRKKVSE